MWRINSTCLLEVSCDRRGTYSSSLAQKLRIFGILCSCQMTHNRYGCRFGLWRGRFVGCIVYADARRDMGVSNPVTVVTSYDMVRPSTYPRGFP